jgi:dihydroorotase
MSERTWLVGGRLLDAARGLDGRGAVAVEGGRIVAVTQGAAEPAAGDRVENLDGAWLIAGMTDLRCALREPGFEEKETIASGLRAAAAGGFTQVCATPNTEPVVDRAAVVAEIAGLATRARAARLLPVGAATLGLRHETLAPIGELHSAGCVALSTGEQPISSAGFMRRLLEYADGFGLVVMTAPAETTMSGVCDEGPWSTRLGLPETPAAAEAIAVSRDLLLCELTGARLHLQRLSTAVAVELVRQAKARGVPVTCDVTPHHLHLTAAALATFDPNVKVRPPLRAEADCAALRAGLADGTIDCVASDHQPHHIEDKSQEFERAATGMSAVETALSLVLALVNDGTLSAARAMALFTEGPRRVLGGGQIDGGPFSGEQGLAVGAPADLTAIDPTHTWIPSASTLQSRGHNTPWLGQALRGRAIVTMVAGDVVWRAAEGS